MKIIVNTNRAEQRKQEVINEILQKAQECAENGINEFTYHFKEGERASFPGIGINEAVSKISEGTVKCGYRCDYGTHVIYIIR